LLRPQDRFERYAIEAPLEQGGVTDAYVALDTRLERRVVLDILRNDATPREHQRFVSRARALSATTHPALAAVFDVSEHGGVAYCTSEHAEGEPLSVHASASAAHARKKLAWIAQLAQGLAAAHAGGAVHGAIQLHHGVVASNGSVRLVFPLGRDANGLATDDVRDLARVALQLVTGHDAAGERLGPLADRLVRAGLPDDAARALAEARAGPPTRSADLANALLPHASFQVPSTEPLVPPLAPNDPAAFRAPRGAVGSAAATLSAMHRVAPRAAEGPAAPAETQGTTGLPTQAATEIGLSPTHQLTPARMVPPMPVVARTSAAPGAMTPSPATHPPGQAPPPHPSHPSHSSHPAPHGPSAPPARMISFTPGAFPVGASPQPAPTGSDPRVSRPSGSTTLNPAPVSEAPQTGRWVIACIVGLLLCVLVVAVAWYLARRLPLDAHAGAATATTGAAAPEGPGATSAPLPVTPVTPALVGATGASAPAASSQGAAGGQAGAPGRTAPLAPARGDAGASSHPATPPSAPPSAPALSKTPRRHPLRIALQSVDPPVVERAAIERALAPLRADLEACFTLPDCQPGGGPWCFHPLDAQSTWDLIMTPTGTLATIHHTEPAGTEAQCVIPILKRVAYPTFTGAHRSTARVFLITDP